MMEEQENKDFKREDIFSRVVRAGKRTYFFDVKATRGGEYYLTLTESKRRFSNDQGKFFYEKHKLFLYKEDFEKFLNGLNDVVKFVETGDPPPEPEAEVKEESKPKLDIHTDIEFEDLDAAGPEEAAD